MLEIDFADLMDYEKIMDILCSDIKLSEREVRTLCTSIYNISYVEGYLEKKKKKKV